jgi:hypothetical protein
MYRSEVGNEELLALHDAQLRGRLPDVPPVGSVVGQDGPLIRIHYGTHGSIDYRCLPPTGLDELIARQCDAFAARGERCEWTIYSHDTPAGLPGRLRAAGFTRSWERTLLVAPVGPVNPAASTLLREAHSTADLEHVAQLGAGAGPQRTSFTEFLADGRQLLRHAEVLGPAPGTPLDAAAWADYAPGGSFVVLGGIVDPGLKLIPYLRGWDWQRRERPAWIRRTNARYLLAEADGILRDALERAGFQPITTATTYHWTPPTPPAATRPVTLLFADAEHDALWDRFTAQFNFRPSTTTLPGITEPSASATWHLGALNGPDDQGVDRLQAVVEQGLRVCAPPGEPLYWLDWQHVGYRFDSQRVGHPGQPHWPRGAFPDGDYYLYLVGDLRMGTFGHPWEETLCVFGSQLLTHVEDDLTAILGAPIRRGGQPAQNT